MRTTPTVIIASLAVLLIVVGCSRARNQTEVIVEKDEPLKFVLSGTGIVDYFEVSGPDRRHQCPKDRLGYMERYWQIAPLTDTDVAALEKMAPITYGKLPTGFRQVVPEHGELPPILETEPGCPYFVTLAIRNGSGVNKMFGLHDGKIVAEGQEP